jgi:hypothetical protein
MSFSDTILVRPRPSSVREVLLPRREKYHPSPSDWRDEVLYFLLPDRFSDGQEIVDRSWIGTTWLQRVLKDLHRDAGERHVSILDDHDHVSGPKIRFSTDAASDRQVVAGTALQLFSLGIPCTYYGSEQSFAGQEGASSSILAGLQFW